MENKIIILDETNGKSAKGKSLKWISEKYDVPYFSDIKKLNEYMKTHKK